MSRVKYLPLAEVTTLVTDGKHGDCKNEENSGYYFLSSKDLRGGKLHYDKPREINYKEFLETHRRTNLETGDILLVNTGASIGRVGIAQIDVRIPNTTFQKSVSVVKADRSIIDNRYLYYFLRNNKNLLSKLGSGSAQPNLLLSVTRNIQVRVPERSIQENISKILTCYDNLIENNNRRIAILEEMAQSLYREWFVNFRYPSNIADVQQSNKDNEITNESINNGADNNNSKPTLIDSPLGPIPEGWEVKALSDVASVNPESITKRNAPELIGYIDIKSVGTGSIEEVKPMKFSDAPSRARRKVVDGDIIWATVRPNRKQYSYICKPKANTIASTGFSVLRALDIPASYLYSFTTTNAFTAYLVNHATGSAYPAVNTDIFKKANILVPPSDILSKFDALCSVSMLQSEVLKKKNENLKKQRDMLLPKLISGQIELKE